MLGLAEWPNMLLRVQIFPHQARPIFAWPGRRISGQLGQYLVRSVLGGFADASWYSFPRRKSVNRLWKSGGILRDRGALAGDWAGP